MIKKAVISVSDDTGLAELARSLTGLGFYLIASEGTQRKILAALDSQGQSAVNSLSCYAAEALGELGPPVGREEAMGWLSGRLPGGLEEDIQLVVCNFKPLQLKNDKVVRDVGGPNLVNAAAMTHRLVVVDSADYDELISFLATSSEVDLGTFKVRLDEKALEHASAYGQEVRAYHRVAQMMKSRDFVPSAELSQD